MRNLFLDYETWSSVNIRRGTDVYMDNARPLLLVYAIDDGPVQMCDFSERVNLYLPNCFFDDDVTFIAHNAFFDRMVTERFFPWVAPIERWHCTQAQALSHSLPGGLGPLCEVLGVPQDLAKITDGKRLIRKFCGPKPFFKETEHGLIDPDWELFKQYAINDILAMRECYKRMPHWNVEVEKRVWQVDQVINNRGFKIDRLFAKNAVEALKAEKKRLNQQTYELTEEHVGAATQRDKLLTYLCEQQGVVLRDLRGSTIEEALEDPTLDEGTKLLLRTRLQSAKASPSKYQRVLDCAGKDDRLRGTLQYAGANRTSRWAGRMFQPQNLPRVTMFYKKDGKLEPDTEAIRACIALVREGHYDAVPLFAPLNTAMQNAARGIIIASDGTVLQGADYSAIESRCNAWVAGEEWKLEAFRNKAEIYKLIYGKAFDIPVEMVTKAQRQQGKVMELALGYQGGVGAFVNMALAYSMDLEELARSVTPTTEAEENYEWACKQGRDYGLPPKVWIACETLKLGYRKANPRTAQFWKDIQDAAVSAIWNPGKKQYVGRLVIDANSEWLRIQLPSGRYLCYCLPVVHADGKISYMAWRNRSWRRTTTYGGKLDENIVQAISRDILAAALVRLHDHSYQVVLHVHDEAVAEVADRPLEEFVRIMTEVPSWAAGFPIAAEGFELRRYEKT